MTPPDIRRVSAAETYPLRHRVLHPELEPDGVGLPGDDRPGAGHFAAYGPGDELVGVVTVTPEAPSWDPQATGAWRLRGMATASEVRGGGVGAALVDRALDHVRTGGARTLWCSARMAAFGFYQRMGFATTGEVWEEPVIGPHIAMTRDVPAQPEPGPERARVPG